MSKQTELGKGRIWFIDVARFYAIALVFYGHFIAAACIVSAQNGHGLVVKSICTINYLSEI